MEKSHISKLTQESISSNVDNILTHIKYCSDNLSKESEMMTYNIKLALWEIFSNFICHGTEESCEDIYVTVEETEFEIILKVTSFGNVFEWTDFQGQECPGVAETRGRGLYILQQICHTFTYEQKGQVAHMIFKKGER